MGIGLMLKQPSRPCTKRPAPKLPHSLAMPSWFWTKRPRRSRPLAVWPVSFPFWARSLGPAGATTSALCRTTSNNAIPLAHSLTAFLMSVVVGAQRFAHCEWLRADRVLHALLGLERFPSDDTSRNFFLRFSQAHIEAFWRPLWRWLLRLLKCPNGGFALDLDSTVFCREGQQEGARKGFNPRRKGRNSHHPAAGGAGQGAVHPARLVAQRQHGRGARSRPVLAGSTGTPAGGMWLRTVRPTAAFLTEPSWIIWRNAGCRMWWWRA